MTPWELRLAAEEYGNGVWDAFERDAHLAACVLSPHAKRGRRLRARDLIGRKPRTGRSFSIDPREFPTVEALRAHLIEIQDSARVEEDE
jgi:hypothetical protein